MKPLSKLEEELLKDIIEEHKKLIFKDGTPFYIFGGVALIGIIDKYTERFGVSLIVHRNFGELYFRGDSLGGTSLMNFTYVFTNLVEYLIKNNWITALGKIEYQDGRIEFLPPNIPSVFRNESSFANSVRGVYQSFITNIIDNAYYIEPSLIEYVENDFQTTKEREEKKKFEQTNKNADYALLISLVSLLLTALATIGGFIIEFIKLFIP